MTTSPQEPRSRKRTNSTNECLTASDESTTHEETTVPRMSATTSPQEQRRSRKRTDLTKESQEDCSTVWRGKFEQEKRKNVELNLQLSFVRGECCRLMRVQSDMSQFINKLQNSLRDWMVEVTTNSDEVDDEEDDDDDDEGHGK